MTASSSRWAAVVLVMLVLVPLAARAQPVAAPPGEDPIETARALYREARALHKQGRLHEAVAKALQAYGVAATPVTALEAGELLVESGRLVEAREVVRSVAQMPVSPRESDKGRDARQLAASLAAQLDMRIPKIAIAARPAGVTVSLDGKTLALADPTAWQGVDPGAHVLAVQVDDRPCTTINLSLSEGEERTLELRDAARACRPEPAPPVEPPRLVPSPPAPPPPERPLAPSPSVPGAWRWVGVAAAGAGVVAVGVGGGIALQAKGNYDDVASECPRACTQNGFDVRTSARSLADAATVVMVAGGVVAVGGVALWFFAPKAGSTGAHAIVGPGTVGFVGSF